MTTTDQRLASVERTSVEDRPHEVSERDGSKPTLARLEAFFASALDPVDIAWLAAFRALFGLTMCVSMLRFIGYGWIDDFWVRPSFHFHYFGFGWVQALSSAQMHALFWGLAALALAVACGALFRVTSVLFLLGFAYLQLIDVTTYLNHYYLAGLLALLLALSPANRAYSLDAWWRARAHARAGREPEETRTVARGWLWLFRFQLAVVYTFAGVAKAHVDWLVYAQPLRIWLGSRTDLPVLGWLFTYEGAALAMSWAGFLFDSTIALWLSLKKTRPFAYAVVIFFHVVTRSLFPIGMFPVIMVLGALVFFPDNWPRKLVSRAASLFGRSSIPAVLVRATRASETGAPRTPPLSRGQRVAFALGALYCALQLVLPVRFLAYDGNVRWGEQGMRFSWRVMVREKNGAVTFLVRPKNGTRVWHVTPRRYLTGLQEREMSGQPDLILQLAHHIAEDFEKRGMGPVEVRVDAVASLNGRPPVRLIDPNVDLTEVHDGLCQAQWIAPPPTMPPPRLRPI